MSYWVGGPRVWHRQDGIISGSVWSDGSWQVNVLSGRTPMTLRSPEPQPTVAGASVAADLAMEEIRERARALGCSPRRKR